MTCAGSPPECRDEPSLAAYRTWKQTEPVGVPSCETSSQTRRHALL